MFVWSPGLTLEYLERNAIEQALKFYQGNKTLTSRALGCAINTINSKLEKYALEDRDAKHRFDEDDRKRAEFDRRQRGFTLPPGTGFSRDPNVTAAALQNEISRENRGVDAPARVAVESAAQAPGKPEMSVQERSKVQSMLQKQSSPGSKKGRS